MSDDGYVVRIRGLPWQSTREEIVDFFKGCKIRNGLNGIFMTLSREGRPSGEAYVDMESEEDFNLALEKNRNHMGVRYIEVFPSKRSEMEWISRKQGNDINDIHDHSVEDTFVRLRGLPFNCNKEDILQFFSGMDLVMDGIVMPTDHTGRSTGEAYIQFASRDIAEKAMTKHKDKIGHRYIEIFKSSFQEFRAVRSYMDSKHYSSGSYGHNSYGPPSHGPSSASYPYHKVRLGHPARPAPYPDRFRGSSYGNGGGYGPPITGASRGPPPGSSRRVYDYDDIDLRSRSSSYGGRYPYDSISSHPMPQSPISSYMGRHTVHMRGLPYKTTEGEIYEFFLPLRPISVRILFDEMGRASGEADVEFATHEDAVKAMNKDKAYIQKRYIELFLHSSHRVSSPHPFAERYGNPSQNVDNGNHRMGPMGGWDSGFLNDDLVRSRV